MKPEKGDHVWWWAREAGGHPHIIRGVLMEHNGSLARVRLDPEFRHPMIHVYTLSYKRLHLKKVEAQ